MSDWTDLCEDWLEDFIAESNPSLLSPLSQCESSQCEHEYLPAGQARSAIPNDWISHLLDLPVPKNSPVSEEVCALKEEDVGPNQTDTLAPISPHDPVSPLQIPESAPASNSPCPRISKTHTLFFKKVNEKLHILKENKCLTPRALETVFNTKDILKDSDIGRCSKHRNEHRRRKSRRESGTMERRRAIAENTHYTFTNGKNHANVEEFNETELMGTDITGSTDTNFMRSNVMSFPKFQPDSCAYPRELALLLFVISPPYSSANSPGC